MRERVIPVDRAPVTPDFLGAALRGEGNAPALPQIHAEQGASPRHMPGFCQGDLQRAVWRDEQPHTAVFSAALRSAKEGVAEFLYGAEVARNGVL